MYYTIKIVVLCYSTLKEKERDKVGGRKEVLATYLHSGTFGSSEFALKRVGWLLR